MTGNCENGTRGTAAGRSRIVTDGCGGGGRGLGARRKRQQENRTGRVSGQDDMAGIAKYLNYYVGVEMNGCDERNEWVCRNDKWNRVLTANEKARAMK